MQNDSPLADESAPETKRRIVRPNAPTLPDSPIVRYQRSIAGNVIFDDDRQVLFVSKSIRLEWGLSPESCRGPLDELLSRLFCRMPGAAEILLRDIHHLMLESSHEMERPICTDWKPGFFFVSSDLTHIADSSWNLSLRISSDLRAIGPDFVDVSKDRLTGAVNRAAFEEQLDLALSGLSATDTSLPLFFLDLDRFKAVNDTLGHGVGDALLKMVSDRIQAALNVSDSLGRLGGDEFAILLNPQIAPQDLEPLAARLIDLVGRPYLIEGQVVNVGASVGIAVAPADGTNRADILRSADLALYHSKNTGRGTSSFFTQAMRTEAEERRALELDLRKALILRQFELHYQPQVEVETQSVIGLEGLLRWRHPKRGLLLPAEFLPLAADIGLLVAIGEWVVKSACKQAAALPNGIAVAVNISAQQFESPNFVPSVVVALKAAALPGHRLEIEVTEDILLRKLDIVCAKLDELRLLGVHVTMDSFGTGLASLSHLVQLPFNKIKIDRSLVNDGPFDLRSRAILRAVSALGQSLGITTLATGVETREHLARVQQEGCQSVQGFFYSTPVPAKELGALLETFPAPAPPTDVDARITELQEA